MMKALIISICMFAAMGLHGDSKDIYIVVSSTFTPHNDISYNVATNRRNDDVKTKAYVACYPIKWKDEDYSEEMVKNTFNEYIQDKDKGTVVHTLEVSRFEDRKEARDFYDSLTKSKDKKQARRISFTKSHLDRAQRKLIIAMREKEKEMEEKGNESTVKPPVVTPPVIKLPVGKPFNKRPIDDIYD